MKRRTWRIMAGVGLGLVAGAIALVLLLNRFGKDEAAVAVPTFEVQRGDVTNSLVVYGTVQPKQEYTFTFDGDRVDSLLVSVGERVTEGQALVKLDPSQQELALLQAERALAEAKAGGVRAEMKEKELALRIAQANYDSATLAAPFAGVVTEINQAAGSNELWTLLLIDTSALYLEVEIDQLDAPSVAVGQPATAVIEPLPTKTWDVEITEIAGMAEELGNSTVVIAKASFPYADPRVLVGYTVEMEIITSSATNVLIAPLSYLTETPRGWIVTKVVDGQPQPQAVTVGVTSDTVAEITSGLQEGDVLRSAARSGAAGPTKTQESGQNPGSGVPMMVQFNGPGMP
ncbi:MAG: biotin/lipoyl-binding protein [Candidatus Bipolaricaulis sp.]|nr:biotin/lipoyl-binding protein [Candidatus Bipolaricaulis sp.]